VHFAEMSEKACTPPTLIFSRMEIGLFTTSQVSTNHRGRWERGGSSDKLTWADLFSRRSNLACDLS
jgi:hypothetical protein